MAITVTKLNMRPRLNLIILVHCFGTNGRRFPSLRYVMTSNVPFEKNKMASTLAASVITSWYVRKMQGG